MWNRDRHRSHHEPTRRTWQDDFALLTEDLHEHLEQLAHDSFANQYDPARAQELLEQIQADAQEPSRAPNPDAMHERTVELPTEEKRREPEAAVEPPVPSPGSDADLAQRLEGARAEMGQIKEKAWRCVPPFMPAHYKEAFAEQLKTKPEGIYYAADPHSLEQLQKYCSQVDLGSYDGRVVKGLGFAWCGAFVGNGYQFGGTIQRDVDGKKSSSPLSASLGSDKKAKRFFQYADHWSSARIEDREAPADAPVEERFKPLRAYHAEHGGERQWLPFAEWGDDPSAVLKPGMMLFIPMVKKPSDDHMTFIERVEQNASGEWVIHTLEGNANAATLAGTYVIGGPRRLDGAARPAPLDFDKNVKMIDQRTFDRMKAEEAVAEARAKSQRVARAL